MKMRTLALTVAILATFNACIWCVIFISGPAKPVPVTGFAVAAAASRPSVAVEASVPVVEERVGVPVRIVIPSIAVNATVEHVALTPDGAMGVPARPLDVGWYAPGPRPGETGSAAMAGHVDDVRGAAAVFADLHKVRPGDAITVESDEGRFTVFMVREIRKYAADADATDVFVSDDGKSYLNLITCGGPWDSRAKQYAERLVVFADRLTE